MKPHRLGWQQISLVLVLLWLSSGCTLNAFEKVDEAQVEALATPSSEISPEQVVHIQLESLQHNDDSNQGIAVAFNFASPGNRQSTGPLARFIKMVKAPPYNSMLNHRSVEFEPIQIEGDSAVQRVKLTGADGQSIIYIFMLSKQTAAPYKNCWMTDAVMVEPTKDLPQDQA